VKAYPGEQSLGYFHHTGLHHVNKVMHDMTPNPQDDQPLPSL